MPDHSQFIREYAKSIGLDPNLALGIANAEGLRAWSASNPNAASRVDVQNGQPFSFGDFQLNIHPGAMGSKALSAGVDPRDPSQWQAADRFALNQMKAGGVGPWRGDPVAKAYLNTGATPGTTLTTSGIVDPSAQAHGSVVNPPIPTDGAAAPTAVASGAVPPNLGGQGDKADQGAAPSQQPQMPSPGPGLQQQQAAGMGNMRQQQLMAMAQPMIAAMLQHAGQPLTYGSLPPGSQVGLQRPPIPTPGMQMGPPGTTLNSMGTY